MQENEMKFKPGDKVKLKLNGSPEMIVVMYKWDPVDGIYVDKVLCTWHNLLQDKKDEWYPENGLEKID